MKIAQIVLPAIPNNTYLPTIFTHGKLSVKQAPPPVPVLLLIPALQLAFSSVVYANKLGFAIAIQMVQNENNVARYD